MAELFSHTNQSRNRLAWQEEIRAVAQEYERQGCIARGDLEQMIFWKYLGGKRVSPEQEFEIYYVVKHFFKHLPYESWAVDNDVPF